MLIRRISTVRTISSIHISHIHITCAQQIICSRSGSSITRRRAVPRTPAASSSASFMKRSRKGDPRTTTNTTMNSVNQQKEKQPSSHDVTNTLPAPLLTSILNALDTAVSSAQRDSALPSSHTWTPFVLTTNHSRRSAATHYTSTVVKNVAAYNTELGYTATGELVTAKKNAGGDDAEAGGKKKMKKRRVKNEKGEWTIIRVEADASENSAAASSSAASSSASSSAAATTASDNASAAAAMELDPSDFSSAATSSAGASSSSPAITPSVPAANAAEWAQTVSKYFQQYLTSPEGESLRTAADIKLEVPAPNASMRGGGFIDFVIVPKKETMDDVTNTTAATSSPTSSSSSLPLPSSSLIDASSSQLDTFTMSSLGSISSVYKLKYGTPRQGTIAPSSRGSLTLNSDIPIESLEGLSEFSHIWLVFIFHKNTNKQFHSRIAPPRAKGAKYGVFATRTPHRINPIGLSLVKLDRIEGRTLYLSSLDLIQGTPIIDIKPYHPADSIPIEGYQLPVWMQQEEKVKPPFTVEFTENAKKELQEIIDKKLFIEFYHDYTSLYEGIRESVSHDPRPNYVRERSENHSEVYGFRFDRLNILFRVEQEKMKAEVCAVQYVDYQLLKDEMKEDGDATVPAAAASSSSATASSSSSSASASSAPRRPPRSAAANLEVDEDAITKRFLELRPRQTYS